MPATTSAHLPLTTTFKPPSACLNNLWAANSTGRIWMNLGPTNTAECLPSGWAPSTYFSPGICPSGYVMATTLEIRSGTMTETVATCCPVASSNTYSLRASAMTTEPWWATEVCAWQPPAHVITQYTYTLTGTDGFETSKTGSMTSPGSINAYGIEIRWQSTDFSTSQATATVAATQAASNKTQASTGNSSSLKTGAKVGIGVGVTAGVVLAIALALGLFWLRRRKRQQIEPVATQARSNEGTWNYIYNEQPTELPAIRHQPLAYEKAELPADRAQTEHNSRQVEQFELDGQSVR